MRRVGLVRRTPLRSTSSLPRGGPIARRTPIKKVNKARKADNFRRCYHSQRRVKFIERLPCAACNYDGPILRDNAHTRNDGAGRKGGYRTIIPLCSQCHGRQHGANGGWLKIGMTAESCRRLARLTHLRWLAHIGEGGFDDAAD